MPYAETESFIRSDAERLWNTGILESLWVEVRDDEPWANGVVGKRIIFNMVKREPGHAERATDHPGGL